MISPLDGGGFVQSFLPENYDNVLIEKGREALYQLTDEYLPEVRDIKHLVVHGSVYQKVTDIAEQLGINLIYYGIN